MLSILELDRDHAVALQEACQLSPEDTTRYQVRTETALQTHHLLTVHATLTLSLQKLFLETMTDALITGSSSLSPE